MDFDPARAWLDKPDQFPRFRPDEVPHRPLSEQDLGPEVELLVVERDDTRLGLLVREMAHHHVAQGRLKTEPYVVTF